MPFLYFCIFNIVALSQCHPERSEGSFSFNPKILHFAVNDVTEMMYKNSSFYRCHSERSEESCGNSKKILHCVQDDIGTNVIASILTILRY
jgi:hypothetical protein